MKKPGGSRLSNNLTPRRMIIRHLSECTLIRRSMGSVVGSDDAKIVFFFKICHVWAVGRADWLKDVAESGNDAVQMLVANLLVVGSANVRQANIPLNTYLPVTVQAIGDARLKAQTEVLEPFLVYDCDSVCHIMISTVLVILDAIREYGA